MYVLLFEKQENSNDETIVCYVFLFFLLLFIWYIYLYNIKYLERASSDETIVWRNLGSFRTTPDFFYNTA